MSEDSAAAEVEGRRSITAYQRDLMVFALRSLSQALYLAAAAMSVVFVLIWLPTGDPPGRLLAGIAGVLAAAAVLWSSANDVPHPRLP
jgi:hypothetical protein